MLDLSSLSAPMTSSLIPETGISMAGNKLPAATAAAPAKSTAAATAATQPSTDGFLQVLEMFLGGSPLPSSLLGSTAITQTTSSEIAMPDLESELQPDAPKELDDATSERIASLLQMLGFQVKPAEIQTLSPLDREQLGNALEFVQRNLERGIDPSQVAENAAMLLPRPWPLDGASGAPVGTADATSATDASISLPAEMASNLEAMRAKIRASLTKGDDKSDASPTPNPVATATTASSPKSTASTGNLAAEVKPAAKRSNSNQNPTPAWMQQIQQMTDPLNADKGTASVPRHLAPGSTASELIGRQVLEKIQIQLNDGHREIKLRLWPEELGEVRLALKMTDGDKVHANMVVENDAVRQALLDAAPQLKEALARHGLDLERLSVSVEQKDAQQAGRDNQGHKQRGQGSNDDQGWGSAEVPVTEELVMGEDTGIRNGRNSFDLWS